MSCDFLNGIHIPVPGQEYPAFRNRECIQELIDCLHQLFLLYLFFYIVAADNALLQFFQCKSDFSPAPFCTVQVSPAVDGDPAGDLPKESGQNGRAMGGMEFHASIYVSLTLSSASSFDCKIP